MADNLCTRCRLLSSSRQTGVGSIELFQIGGTLRETARGLPWLRQVLLCQKPCVNGKLDPFIQDKCRVGYEDTGAWITQIHKALARVFFCFARLDMAWDSPNNSVREKRKSLLFEIPIV